MSDQFIEAIGKTLSQKNVSRLKEIWSSLTELLASTGNLEIEDLPKTLIDPQSQYDLHNMEGEIAASGRKGIDVGAQLECTAWAAKVNRLADIFALLLRTYPRVFKYEQEGEAEFEPPEERLSRLLKEITDAAFLLCKEKPDTRSNADIYASSGEGEKEDFGDPSISKAEGETESESTSDVETETLMARDLAEAEGEVREVFNIEIAARAMPTAKKAANERPIDGILFQVDRPSEAIPEVGPGLPLLIPKEVALAAIADITPGKPKPLDAHDTFARHSNRDIVGAMTSAYLEGDDLVVQGVLWDYNQPDKIQAIGQETQRLGMSVNATADGHVAEWGGTKVWQVDRLQILGANILFSDKATFKRTRIIRAISKSSLGDFEQPIAARAEDSPDSEDLPLNKTFDPEEDTMSNEAISQQIQVIASSVKEVQTIFAQELEALQEAVRDLSTQVSDIQYEREQSQSSIQAAAQEEAKQKEREDLLASIAEVVDAKLANLPGPRRAGYSIPLAASSPPSATAGDRKMEIQLQLSKLNGQIEVMQRDPNMSGSPEIISLIDNRRQLVAQLESFAN
jgi:outer membrane murein-binding lipoprotein Lpp